LLLYQSIISSIRFQTRNIVLLERTAYIILAMVLVGVCLLLLGITSYLIRGSPKIGMTKSPSIAIVLSLVLNDRPSFRAFVLACLLYGLFFAFASGFLVYQPLGRFSETYGVTVPSMLPVICCGPLGQMPQFVVYLTEQFAILIVPVNLILLISVSWLVGLNVSIATFSYRNRSNNKSGKWFGGLGAIVGIFTACPTCAGFLSLTILSLAGSVAFASMLSSLQIVFLAVGLPMLLLTPIMTGRKMQNEWTTSCGFPGNKEAGGRRAS
jgi:hypothetical protein